MIPLTHYLSPTGQQVIEYVSKAHYKIQQNGSFCSNKDLVGSAIAETRTFLICTRNMLNQSLSKEFIEETVNHEAVHVAQSCNRGRVLGIPINEMTLPANKIQDLRRSISITKNPRIRGIEHEAYWLEDKPEQVIYYLKKFCFK